MTFEGPCVGQGWGARRGAASRVALLSRSHDENAAHEDVADGEGKNYQGANV